MIRRILYETLASTPYPALWNWTTFRFRSVHTLTQCRHFYRTNLTTVDDNRTFTGTFFTRNGFTNTSRMSRMTKDVYILCFVTSAKCTHITGITTTKDTIKDIATTHSDIGVAKDVGRTAATIDTTTIDTTTNDLFINGDASKIYSIIYFLPCCSSTSGNLLGTDIHMGISCDVSLITTTIDVANNVGTKNGFLIITHRIAVCCSPALVKPYLLYRTDIHRGITNHISSITTTEDTAFNVLIISIGITTTDLTQCSGCSTVRRSINLVDVHRRITVYNSTRTQTTTEYFTDAGTRDDIDLRMSVRCLSMVICTTVTKENSCTRIVCRCSRSKEWSFIFIIPV